MHASAFLIWQICKQHCFSFISFPNSKLCGQFKANATVSVNKLLFNQLSQRELGGLLAKASSSYGDEFQL